VTPFAAKLRDGSQFLGLGLSDLDLLRLKTGDPVTIDLSSIGVGIWVKEADGSRSFIQPRESKVVVIAGDSTEDIGTFLNVDLP
jgi:hypothetical protein